MKVSPKDLYRLGKAQLLVEKRNLAAQQAEQSHRELLLEIQQECGIIGQTAPIDLETGEIAQARIERPKNGKGKGEMETLITVTEGD